MLPGVLAVSPRAIAGRLDRHPVARCASGPHLGSLLFKGFPASNRPIERTDRSREVQPEGTLKKALRPAALGSSGADGPAGAADNVRGQ
jgi:hypothetical protein